MKDAVCMLYSELKVRYILMLNNHCFICCLHFLHCLLRIKILIQSA